MRHYTTEPARIEHEQVEWVFRLTGGELEREPWKDSEGHTRFAYWYESVPERDTRHSASGEYRTGIGAGCGFSPPPERIPDKHGEWVLVKTYANSGGTECPLRNDPETRCVTREHAHLVSRHPRGKRAECPLCEEHIGEEHGYIYLGESYEAVYRFEPAAQIHRSKVGTYHPNPKAEVAWTINDTSGYIDAGPSCDECGACECACDQCDACAEAAHDCEHSDDRECIGLPLAYVCLDGGDSLCETCAEKADIRIVPCDCK